VTAPSFRPEDLFRLLAKHGVDYVLIGGLAAVLRGSPLRTSDMDVCPKRSADNLTRLAGALREAGARIRTAGAPDGLPFACDEKFLAGVALLNLTTAFGDLDISFQPAGTEGFEDLEKGAERFDLQGVVAPVAALEDIIRSKEAANRPKDIASLPTLRTLLAETRRRAGKTD
jgi:hypothetical protein